MTKTDFIKSVKIIKKLRLCQDSNLVALNSEKLAQSAVNVMVIWTFLLLDRVDPMERFKFKKIIKLSSIET